MFILTFLPPCGGDSERKETNQPLTLTMCCIRKTEEKEDSLLSFFSPIETGKHSLVENMLCTYLNMHHLDMLVIIERVCLSIREHNWWEKLILRPDANRVPTTILFPSISVDTDQTGMVNRRNSKSWEFFIDPHV